MGFGSIEEIKNHPYFAGINWAIVNKRRVPYNPPQVRAIKPLLISNSFSDINSKSPLQKSTSKPTSPCRSPIISSNRRDEACFGGSDASKKVLDDD